jgi:hypothetical protein
MLPTGAEGEGRVAVAEVVQVAEWVDPERFLDRLYRAVA